MSCFDPGRIEQNGNPILRLQESPRKLSDVARNGDEFKAVVYLANSLVRALVANAKEEVREKLLSQFEAWFR